MEESALSYFLMGWLDPSLLLLTAIGTFAGVYIGAIPGLSVTMAVSILISFTFTWDQRRPRAHGRGIHGRRLRWLADRDPAQYSGRPERHRHGAGWLPTRQARRGRHRHRRHDGDLRHWRLHRHRRTRARRAAHFGFRPPVRAARLSTARDHGHPAGGEPVRRVAGKGRLRRRPRYHDRHGGARPDDRRRPAHLRLDGPARRHLLCRRDDRHVRRGRGARPASLPPHRADQAEGHPDRAGLAHRSEVSAAVAAHVGDRRRHRRAPGHRRRHRGAHGLRPCQAEREEAEPTVRPGRLRGWSRPRLPTTPPLAVPTSRCSRSASRATR